MSAYRKKLIEVALPLDAINKESAREKSIRHGHPSTLHLWWARRPLAACRAVLFASLVDDPSALPEQFPTEEAQEAERQRLFRIIEALVKWENSNDEAVLDAARREIARCVARAHDVELAANAVPAQVAEALREYAPPVLDPFCGGGSIPLEAQRLGLEAHASDLNPVAVLITKALIEIPPKFAGQPPVNPEARKDLFASGNVSTAEGAEGRGAEGQDNTKSHPLRSSASSAVNPSSAAASPRWTGAKGLAEDVRYYGKWMRDEAERRIGHLYPKVKLPPEQGGGEATGIAWLWARTVKCPNPACSAQMPLVRSFALSTKKGKEAWVEPIVNREAKTVRFEVRSGKRQSHEGTVNRRGATCIVCGTTVQFDHIRSEGKAHCMGAQLMAIVAEGQRERVYVAPNAEHEAVAAQTEPDWAPETDLPEQALGFRVQLYGMTKHRDLFTPRQLVALTAMSDLVGKVRERVQRDASAAGLTDDVVAISTGQTGAQAYADAVATYLAFALDKAIDRNTSLCTWEHGMDRMRGTFGRQTLSMIWDFAETNPFAGAGGDLGGSVESLSEVLETLGRNWPGETIQRDAASGTHIREVIYSTDPPYYDNIGYADLSDFFYIWLRHSLVGVYPELFTTLLVPKTQELIAATYRFNGSKERAQQFFEEGLRSVFTQMRKAQSYEYPVTIYYAFRQAESEEDEEAASGTSANGAELRSSTGWETMLEGLRNAAFAVTGTWPVRTEQAKRMRDQEANALASSIVLVCRPRPENAPLATRREFLTQLRRELPTALKTLQRENIAPVDLAQAAIGPGMAVFSRYSKVVEADGSPMRVRTALQLINQTLDEVLAEQESEYDADTRWAVAWFDQYGMNEGPYGVGETLSKAKNTAVAALVEAGILQARGGKVRLLARDELSPDWSPTTDTRLTVWEVTQYLIRALQKGGEGAAADLQAQVGSVGEVARDLAYRLYTTCERKGWAQEALAYNSLVVAWPAIQAQAASRPTAPTQGTLL
ncbi:MAG: DUF1156 domain-containing protein [Anaerolineae bacterium]